MSEQNSYRNYDYSVSSEATWGGFTQEEVLEQRYKTLDEIHTQEIEVKYQKANLDPLERTNMLTGVLKVVERISTAESKEPDVRGIENIPTEGGYIIAMQHAHTIDLNPRNNPTFFLNGLYRAINKRRGEDDLRLITDKGAYEGSRTIIQPLIDSTNPIYVERTKRSMLGRAEEITTNKSKAKNLHALSEAVECVKNSQGILIAPEGRREKTLSKGQRGIGHIAFETGAPVIPMAFYSDERGNHLIFGEPYIPAKPPNYDQLSADEQKQAQLKAAHQTMVRIAELLPERYRGRYSTEVRQKNTTRPEGITSIL